MSDASPGNEAGGPGRLRKLLGRFWPEERLAVVYFVATVLAFSVAGYPFEALGMGYEYLEFAKGFLFFALPCWGMVQLYRLVRRRFDGRRAAGDLLLFARAIPPLLLILVAYTNLKARLFVFRPELSDPWLSRLDALVHFGGGDLIGWLLGFTGVEARDLFLAYVYVLAWVVLALPLGVAFAVHGGSAARRVLAAFGLAYLVGGFLYFLFPSVGPAFFVRERFAHLAGNPAYALQTDMLQWMLYLIAHPYAKAVPFFGIAAFPSLHMATTALGALICWTYVRWLLVLIIPGNLLVAWSALHFGWHYIIDFYPGIAIALFAWWATGKWLGPRAEDGPESPAAAAAGAAS